MGGLWPDSLSRDLGTPLRGVDGMGYKKSFKCGEFFAAFMVGVDGLVHIPNSFVSLRELKGLLVLVVYVVRTSHLSRGRVEGIVAVVVVE